MDSDAASHVTLICIHFDEYDQKIKGIPFVLGLPRSVKWILLADVAKQDDLDKTSDLNRIPEMARFFKNQISSGF